MSRRTFAQVAAEARADERDACIAMLREKIGEVEGLHARGRLDAAETMMLVRRLDAIADGIATGLHVPDEVRPA